MRRLAITAALLVACAATAGPASGAGTVNLAWTPQWSHQFAGDWLYRVAEQNPYAPETLVRYRLPSGEMEVIREIKSGDRMWEPARFAASGDFVVLEDFEQLPKRRGSWPQRFSIVVRNVATGEETVAFSRVSNFHPRAKSSPCRHSYRAVGVTPGGDAILLHDSLPRRGCRQLDSRRFRAIELRRRNGSRQVLRRFTSMTRQGNDAQSLSRSNGEISLIRGRCRTGPRRHADCAVAIRLSDAAVSPRLVIDGSTKLRYTNLFGQFDPADPAALLLTGRGDPRGGLDPARTYMKRWRPFAGTGVLEDLVDAPLDPGQQLIKCGSGFMVFSWLDHTYERELAGLPMSTLAPLGQPEAPLVQSSSVERDVPLLCRDDYVVLTKFRTQLIPGSRGGGLFEGPSSPLHDWILTRD